jgi:hypothetical protein
MKLLANYKNISSVVILISALWVIGVFTWGYTNFEDQTTRAIRLTQVYGLTAISLLYVTHLLHALKGLGNKYLNDISSRSLISAFTASTFGAAVLHSFQAFFFNLGGFEGLSFLSEKYFIAIALGDVTLFALFLIVLSSVTFFSKKKTFLNSKFLYAAFYLGGITILIHILMLGSHFADLSQTIPKIFYFAILILLTLESIRADKWLRPKLKVYPSFGFILPIVLLLCGYFGHFVFGGLATGGETSLGIHAQHIKLAQDAQQKSSSNVIGSKGDPTKRFRVEMSKDLVGLNGSFQFSVFDASNGSTVPIFEDLYEKKMHLIVVDSSLEFYNHIHPEYLGNGQFSINTTFPKNGKYFLYADFQPLGAIEQQYAFQVNVGGDNTNLESTQEIDTNLSKTFGEYEVILSGESKWIASAMSVGQQRMVFTLKKGGQDVTNLMPYLGAFGHLVMINQKTYQYIHVHPMGLPPVVPDELRGPSVEFSPIGLYGQIPKGVYRVFGQFNPDGKLMTVDYTIEVQ